MIPRNIITAALIGCAAANSIVARQITAKPSATKASIPTAISGCHTHATEMYCVSGDAEFLVKTPPPANPTDMPALFDGCHSHGSKTYCIAPDGEDVEIQNMDAAEEPGHDDHDHGHGDKADDGHQHCHFHAGVEHCVGGSEEEREAQCEFKKRDYNIPLRVGLLFVILVSSALGVMGPIILQRALPKKLNNVFVVLKQFGTGIIISTAFVHLYTHATLMFTNKCLGELQYEGTTSAIVMAGIFLSFIIEYIGHRIVLKKTTTAARLNAAKQADAYLSAEIVSVLVMEAGILFHSLLIGLTLVVAGDSFFITLFIVILFHQIFEGIALGTRIAAIGTKTYTAASMNQGDETDADKNIMSTAVASNDDTSMSTERHQPTLSFLKKMGLASLFAFITPLGMAIGIGVLSHFNGNDKSTIIAIGTLDALSAGILVWVGLVEMWAADWMVGVHGQKAELADADMLTVALAGFGLVTGMIVMSVLGKWA